MLSIQIKDLKKFTSLLFTEDTFDKFCLHDAVFRTSATTVIDGSRNTDFYREGETAPEALYVYWSELRPACFALIRGKHLPGDNNAKIVSLRQTVGNRVLVDDKVGINIAPIAHYAPPKLALSRADTVERRQQLFDFLL